MPITIEINAKQLKNELQMHYLPAKINGDGAANIDEYFNNYTQADVNDKKILTNAFRGYPLQGTVLNVPHDYTGVVVQETRKPLSEDEERTLRVTGTFDKFHYWNYDKVPSKADAYSQALQVINISKELANPISLTDVEAEMEKRRQKLATKEN